MEFFSQFDVAIEVGFTEELPRHDFPYEERKDEADPDGFDDEAVAEEAFDCGVPVEAEIGSWIEALCFSEHELDYEGHESCCRC